MKLHIYTLALDAMPYLAQQLDVFEKLKIEWHWHVMEGVADSVLDTSWVKKILPRFSIDGTSEFINARLMEHDRVSVYRKQLWHGKVEMCNAAIMSIKEPCVLMQVDADEFWTPDQLEKIVSLFDETQYDSMRFFCRYFIGKEIVTVGENSYGNNPGEWHRAWRFKPGMSQEKHEPPILAGCGKNCMSREQTREQGLVFNHYAYATEAQVAFKERYYGYENAVAHWRRLQQNTAWPVKLQEFLPWVDVNAMADKI